jgi:Metal binding domain of Ada
MDGSVREQWFGLKATVTPCYMLWPAEARIGMRTAGFHVSVFTSEIGQSSCRPWLQLGMIIDDDVCYRALVARDTRFDGVFFVGVKTTGIYCRPVCTAKTPGRDRRRFFASAALAEQAGFRPPSKPTQPL